MLEGLEVGVLGGVEFVFDILDPLEFEAQFLETEKKGGGIRSLVFSSQTAQEGEAIIDPLEAVGVGGELGAEVAEAFAEVGSEIAQLVAIRGDVLAVGIEGSEFSGEAGDLAQEFCYGGGPFPFDEEIDGFGG
jgi:hypothetical protein